MRNRVANSKLLRSCENSITFRGNFPLYCLPFRGKVQKFIPEFLKKFSFIELSRNQLRQYRVMWRLSHRHNPLLAVAPSSNKLESKQLPPRMGKFFHFSFLLRNFKSKSSRLRIYIIFTMSGRKNQKPALLALFPSSCPRLTGKLSSCIFLPTNSSCFCLSTKTRSCPCGAGSPELS